MIFTIGHSNHPIEFLLKLLHTNAIDMVVDVRSTPYSKFNPQYNLKPFKEAVVDSSIQYKVAGQYLGGKSKCEQGDVNYDSKISKIVALSNSGLNVALLCSEKDPKKCHRGFKLTPSILKHGNSVTHILPTGNQLIEPTELDMYEDDIPFNLSHSIMSVPSEVSL